MKFKVGNLIKGTQESDKRYSCITSKMTKAKVLGAYKDGTIHIEILEHENCFEIGQEYTVADEFFELCKPAPKFKVGDIITGNSETYYYYTNTAMTKGKVIELLDAIDEDDDDIKVEIQEHRDRSQIGHKFQVQSKYFDLVEGGEKQMTKTELKTGMWIQKRDGRWGMVLLGTPRGDFYVGNTYGSISNINDNLTSKVSKNLDIVKVYEPKLEVNYLPTEFAAPNPSNMKLLWERKPEIKEISKDEAFKILKDKFGCDVKITE